MAFTAADVKKLREMTSVGMMDCKKALTETDGDMDKAVEWLREKGLAKAAKKAGRIAAEGMAYATVCEKCGVGAMVEVNCETDFCAKSAPFVQFVKDICQVVLENNPADVEAIKDCTYPGTELKVSEVLPASGTRASSPRTSSRKRRRSSLPRWTTTRRWPPSPSRSRKRSLPAS